MSGAPAIPTYGTRLANARAFARDTAGIIRDCARLAPVVRLPVLGATYYALNDPELVEEVVVRQHAHLIKDRFSRRLREFLGDGLLTGEGEPWRRQRRLIQPAFHRRKIAAYADIFVRLGEAAIAGWSGVRDVHRDLAELTLRIVGETLFGADVGGTTEAVDEALTLVMGRYGGEDASGLLPLWVPTAANRRIRRAIGRLDGVILGLIAERRRRRAAGPDPDDDLLALLLAAQDEDGARMTDAQLRDECVTLFLAGHETTALALTYAAYLLACHPDEQERAAAQVRDVLGDRPPTLDDLPRLPAIDPIFKETLRLYPPAWSIGRQALAPVRAGPHTLPAGAQLAVFMPALHRDPRYFPEPDRFHPARWQGDLERTLPKLAFMPFGAGPRICIGNAFAAVEGALLLACLLRRHRIDLAQAPHLDLQHSITLRPRGGVRLRLTPRPAP